MNQQQHNSGTESAEASVVAASVPVATASSEVVHGDPLENLATSAATMVSEAAVGSSCTGNKRVEEGEEEDGTGMAITDTNHTAVTTCVRTTPSSSSSTLPPQEDDDDDTDQDTAAAVVVDTITMAAVDAVDYNDDDEDKEEAPTVKEEEEEDAEELNTAAAVASVMERNRQEEEEEQEDEKKQGTGPSLEEREDFMENMASDDVKSSNHCNDCKKEEDVKTTYLPESPPLPPSSPTTRPLSLSSIKSTPLTSNRHYHLHQQQQGTNEEDRPKGQTMPSTARNGSSQTVLPPPPPLKDESLPMVNLRNHDDDDDDGENQTSITDNEAEVLSYIRQHSSAMKKPTAACHYEQATIPGAIAVTTTKESLQQEKTEDIDDDEKKPSSRDTTHNMMSHHQPPTLQSTVTHRISNRNGGRTDISPPPPPPSSVSRNVSTSSRVDNEILSKLSGHSTTSSTNNTPPRRRRTTPQRTRSRTPPTTTTTNNTREEARRELEEFETQVGSKSRPAAARVSAEARAELEELERQIGNKAFSGPLRSTSPLRNNRDAYISASSSNLPPLSPGAIRVPGAVPMPPDDEDVTFVVSMGQPTVNTTDARNGCDAATVVSSLSTSSRRLARLSYQGGSKRLSQGTLVALPVEDTWGVLEQQQRLEELEKRASELQHERDNAPRATQVVIVDEEDITSNNSHSDIFGRGSNHSSSRSRNHSRNSLISLILDPNQSVSEDNETAKSALWRCGIICIGLVIIGAVIVVVLVVMLGPKSKSSSEVPIVTTTTELPTSTPTFTTSMTLSPSSSPTISSPASLPPTLQMIRERGYVKCRGSPDEVEAGIGFSVDMCSAIAAAILGDKTKFQMPYLTLREQFTAIANGTVDVSTAQTTPTMQRDVLEPISKYGMSFTTPYFYSGTTFAGIPEFVDCADRGETLRGACRDLKVCVADGSVTQDLVRDLLGGAVIQTVTTQQEFFYNLKNGTCNVITGAPMLIYEQAAIDAGYTGPYTFAPRFYNRDPLALMTRNQDVKFSDMINWILRALIVAETKNITQETATEFPTMTLFGNDYQHMFQNAIAAVGNFGELYQRTWEDRVPRMAGGINSPHTLPKVHGGLLYSNPLGKIDDLQSANHAQELGLLGPIVNGTLERIVQRSQLRCGIIVNPKRQETVPGLVHWNKTFNEYVGMDVDYCRGITAALFEGNSEPLVLVPYLSLEDGFHGLVESEVDVVAGSIYSMVNDILEPTTQQGFSFSDVYYHHHDETQDSNVVAYAMATRQDDVQWTDFVRSMVAGTIHAEASNIDRNNAIDMPTFELFGTNYRQALRDVILTIGNYAELYQRHVEPYIPRQNNTMNQLNTGGNPMFYSYWEF